MIEYFMVHGSPSFFGRVHITLHVIMGICGERERILKVFDV